MAFLNEQDAAFIRKRFEEELASDVTLEFFAPSLGGLALPGQDAEMAEYARQILTEVAALSPRITLNVHSLASEPETAARFGVARTPALAILGAADYGVRFYGMPGGYEFATLLELILDVSKAEPPLSAGTKTMLGRLKDQAHIQVFVTPTCPHCPRAARLAALLAIGSEKIRADIVEAGEFPDLVERFGVYAVPKTVINETTEFVGAQPEAAFVGYVAQAAGLQEEPATPAES